MRTREGMSFVLLSLYLPNTAHSWEAYVEAIGVVDTTVTRLRSYAKGPCHLILGGDANCEVCEDGRFVGPAVLGPHRVADSEKHFRRQACVRAFMEKWNLGWNSSWSTSFPHWTICHTKSKELYTLDYVWASHDLQLDVHVRYDMDFNADHRPLQVSFAWTLCVTAENPTRNSTKNGSIGKMGSPGTS